MGKEKARQTASINGFFQPPHIITIENSHAGTNQNIKEFDFFLVDEELAELGFVDNPNLNNALKLLKTYSKEFEQAMLASKTLDLLINSMNTAYWVGVTENNQISQIKEENRLLKGNLKKNEEIRKIANNQELVKINKVIAEIANKITENKAYVPSSIVISSNMIIEQMKLAINAYDAMITHKKDKITELNSRISEDKSKQRRRKSEAERRYQKNLALKLKTLEHEIASFREMRNHLLVLVNKIKIINNRQSEHDFNLQHFANAEAIATKFQLLRV